MSVARSLIYRYLAYSMEMKKEEDQAEEYYRMAADIAIQMIMMLWPNGYSKTWPNSIGIEVISSRQK